jgi:site-specific DNA-methyltransferase (adenine-specific)
MIRIENKDCLELLGELENESVDLILIDPPYPIDTNNGTNRFTEGGWIDGSADHYGTDWYEDFSLKVIEMVRVLKPGRHFYCFVDEKNLFLLRPYLDRYMEFKKVIIWHKKHFGLGYHYRNVIEYCFLFSKGKSERHITDQPNFYMDDKDAIDFHPTVKSSNMCRWLIQNSTEEGETVFDGYSGSGTTAYSCHKEKRSFIGSEINKEFYEKSLRRITDETAKLTFF